VDSKLFQVDESHMQAMDRVLQNWRIRQAGRFIRDGDKLLDVGCFDGCLLQRYRPKLKRAAGLDPLVVPFQSEEFEIYADVLPGKVRFEDGFETSVSSSFQLGLNRLFVFEEPAK